MGNYYWTDDTIQALWQHALNKFNTENQTNELIQNKLDTLNLDQFIQESELNKYVLINDLQAYQNQINSLVASYGTVNYIRKRFSTSADYENYFQTKEKSAKLYYLFTQEYIPVRENDNYDINLNYYKKINNPYIKITNLDSQDSLYYYQTKYPQKIYYKETTSTTYIKNTDADKYSSTCIYYIKLSETDNRYIETILTENEFNQQKTSLFYGTDQTYEEAPNFFEPFLEYYEVLNGVVYENELQNALLPKMTLERINISNMPLFKSYENLGIKDFFVANDPNPIIPIIINNLLDNKIFYIISNKQYNWSINNWQVLYNDDKPSYYLCILSQISLVQSLSDLDNETDNQIILNNLSLQDNNYIICLYNIKKGISYFKNYNPLETLNERITALEAKVNEM